MVAAGRPWKWVKPEIYPLVAVVAVACSVGIYSSIRHFWTNPEVYLNRAYRQEGVPETEEMAKRAKGYEESIFRSLQARRGQAAEGPGGDRNTRIF